METVKLQCIYKKTRKYLVMYIQLHTFAPCLTKIYKTISKMKKPISARIDEETLTYIKGCHEPINTLINTLLRRWMNNRQIKELLIWKEDTGQDELSQMKEKNNFKCSQCCNSCIWCNNTWCMKNDFSIGTQTRPKSNFCCIYWEHKKKGSR